MLVKWPNLYALTKTARSGNVDSLNVYELLNPIVGELAPVAAFLDCAEGQPRIRAYMLVDKDHPAVDELGGNVLSAGEIAREDAAAKPGGGAVGRCDRLLLAS